MTERLKHTEKDWKTPVERQNTPLTTALRKILWYLLALLRNAVVDLLCRLGLSGGETITVGSLRQWAL